MELGIYTFGDIHTDPVQGTTVSPEQNTQDLLERARLADEVGLHYFGVGEHHRPDYSVTSPSTVLAAIAAPDEADQGGECRHGAEHRGPCPGVPAVRHHRPHQPGPRRADGRPRQLHRVLPPRRQSGRLRHTLRRAKLDLLLKLNEQERITWRGNFRPDLDDALILPRPFRAEDGGRELDIWIAIGGT